MTKQEMEKLAHLTPRKDGQYSMYASVPSDIATVISNALVREKAKTGEGIAAIIRRGILELNQVSVYMEKEVGAQERIDHALEIIRQHGPPPYLLGVVEDVLKALTACPTESLVEFVGESKEYKEFWKQDDKEQDNE